jgi:hypothetical protein
MDVLCKDRPKGITIAGDHIPTTAHSRHSRTSRAINDSHHLHPPRKSPRCSPRRQVTPRRLYRRSSTSSALKMHSSARPLPHSARFFCRHARPPTLLPGRLSVSHLCRVVRALNSMHRCVPHVSKIVWPFSRKLCANKLLMVYLPLLSIHSAIHRGVGWDPWIYAC